MPRTRRPHGIILTNITAPGAPQTVPYETGNQGITQTYLNTAEPDTGRAGTAHNGERWMRLRPIVTNRAQAPITYYEEKAKEKKVIVDKTTFDVILDLGKEVLAKEKQKYLQILKKDLDKVEREAYNEIGQEEDEYMEKSQALSLLKDGPAILRCIEMGNLYFSTWNMVLAIEKLARSKYDIEQSKYKYYPRLKAHVNYGDKDLLYKILEFTQTKQGRLLWK